MDVVLYYKSDVLTSHSSSIGMERTPSNGTKYIRPLCVVIPYYIGMLPGTEI